MGWIGVDLDGTLAYHEAGTGIGIIGRPIQRMLDRVWSHLRAGEEVRIFTARAEYPEQEALIQKWLIEECGLPALKVTNKKDFAMIMFYDDRAVQVVENTGIVVMSPVEPTVVLPQD